MTLYPLSSPNNNPDPYPQYLTQNEADQLYSNVKRLPSYDFADYSWGNRLNSGIYLIDIANNVPWTTHNSIGYEVFVIQSSLFINNQWFSYQQLWLNNDIWIRHTHSGYLDFEFFKWDKLVNQDYLFYNLNNHTHTISQVSGTLPISQGGTGRTTAQSAINLLAGGVTNNRFLRGNGTNIVLSQVSLNTNDVSGILPIINGGTNANNISSARINLQVNSSDIAITFNTGWRHHSSPVWILRVSKFSNWINISGVVSRISGTNNVILTLPTNCRPIENQMLNCIIFFNNIYYQCRVDIQTSGNITLSWASATIPSVIGWLQINATFITASA